jgi:hypothetical protein
MSLSIFLVGNGCANQPEFKDDEIKAYWIKTGEIAPFDGILLNEKTYYELRKKLLENS